MSEAENRPAAGAIAWPGRLLTAILGTPSSKCGQANGRLRYRACAKCASSVGPINVVANVFLMIMKGYLGVVGRSTALIADAIHSGADVVASAMLVFGLRVARKPADGKYQYGYGKVEFLVAVVIYTSLIAAGVVIFFEAITCIIHKEQVSPSAVAIWGAVISIIVNELMFRQSVCAGKQLNSPSMVANAWEKRSDALSSGAVLLGILGAKLGFHFLDPAAAILVAVYILKFSGEMLWEAFKGLLDEALDPELLEGIRKSTGQVGGVMGIGTIRSREIGQKVWIDLEILVRGDAPMEEVSRIKEAVKQAITGGMSRPSSINVYVVPASA